MLGIPSTASISNFTQGDLRYRYWGGFIQDDWKATSKLTINAGLRYELWTQPVERHNSQANFFLADRKLAYAFNNVPAGVPASAVERVPLDIDTRSLLKTSYTNLAPRLGFAYQASTVSRDTGRRGNFLCGQSVCGSVGTAGCKSSLRDLEFLRDGQYHAHSAIEYRVSGGGRDCGELQFGQPGNLRARPRERQRLSLEHGRAKQAGQYVFDVNYVGTRAVKLPLGYNVNQHWRDRARLRRAGLYQGFNDIAGQVSMGYSRYNALEARAERRYSNGLSLLVSYTYSKSLDNGGEHSSAI